MGGQSQTCQVSHPIVLRIGRETHAFEVYLKLTPTVEISCILEHCSQYFSSIDSFCEFSLLPHFNFRFSAVEET